MELIWKFFALRRRPQVLFSLGRWFLEKENKGFTFLELALVVLMMGILAIVAIPSFVQGGNFYRLQIAADEVVADIRSIQQRALTEENNTYALQFDPTNEKYDLRSGAKILRLVWLPPTTDLEYTNFPGNRLSFSTKGVPSQGGHLRLKDKTSGKCLYVIVAAVTGRVRIDTVVPGADETGK